MEKEPTPVPSSEITPEELYLNRRDWLKMMGIVTAGAFLASSGIGAGLASVIPPAKLQNASASIGRIGEEAGVLRVTFVISLLITAVAAVMALIWAF